MSAPRRPSISTPTTTWCPPGAPGGNGSPFNPAVDERLDVRSRNGRHEGLDRLPAARAARAAGHRRPSALQRRGFVHGGRGDRQPAGRRAGSWTGRPLRADYAVVMEGGEGRAIGCGHNGVVWLDVVVHGRAAHGSHARARHQRAREHGRPCAGIGAVQATPWRRAAFRPRTARSCIRPSMSAACSPPARAARSTRCRPAPVSASTGA